MAFLLTFLDAMKCEWGRCGVSRGGSGSVATQYIRRGGVPVLPLHVDISFFSLTYLTEAQRGSLSFWRFAHILLRHCLHVGRWSARVHCDLRASAFI